MKLIRVIIWKLFTWLNWLSDIFHIKSIRARMSKSSSKSTKVSIAQGYNRYNYCQFPLKSRVIFSFSHAYIIVLATYKVHACIMRAVQRPENYCLVFRRRLTDGALTFFRITKDFRSKCTSINH